MKPSKISQSGQSLIEVLIAISIGALIIGSAAGALVFTVRSNAQNRATQAASSLVQELLDNVRSKAESNWQSLYALDKSGGTEFPYHLDTSLNFVKESEIKNVNNIDYTRYFIVENINRDNCGTKDITSAGQTPCSPSQTGVLEDPSTQQITAKVTWSQGGDKTKVAISEYITRFNNEVDIFTDWSGAAGVEGSITQPGNDYSSQSGLDVMSTVGSIKLEL